MFNSHSVQFINFFVTLFIKSLLSIIKRCFIISIFHAFNFAVSCVSHVVPSGYRYGQTTWRVGDDTILGN
jgi:hypothetical protein